MTFFLSPLFSFLAFVVLFFKLPGVPEFFGLPACTTCSERTPYVPMLSAAYFAGLTTAFLIYPQFPSRSLRKIGLTMSLGLMGTLTYLNSSWCIPCLIAHCLHILAWLPKRFYNSQQDVTSTGVKVALLFVAPIAALALMSTLNFTLLIYGLKKESPFDSLVQVGSIVQDFKNDLLLSSTRDESKGTLFFFTGQNCPHCKTLLPEIEMLAAKHKEFKFYNISRSFDPKLKISYPNQEWISDTKGELFPYFGISGFPTVILVGPDRKVWVSAAGAGTGMKEKLENAFTQMSK